MRLLLLGSTGLVGGHVLELALRDSSISVVAPVRRPLPAHASLVAPVIDFENLPDDAALWEVDALISALGTTMRIAGSKDAFRRIDYDYPLAAARLAHAHGVPTFVLNSAMGANPSSVIFYNRVKGDLERDLDALGFHSLTFVRPGLIGGQRAQRRPAEHAATIALRTLDPIVPKRWRINPASQIAASLLEAARSARSGTHVVSSGDLIRGSAN